MNTPSNPKPYESVPFRLRFAHDALVAEMQYLRACAEYLTKRLEPIDADDDESSGDVVAWRMAEVLRDHLADGKFVDTMRRLVLDESH